jgi:hypothetical protein
MRHSIWRQWRRKTLQREIGRGSLYAALTLVNLSSKS